MSPAKIILRFNSGTFGRRSQIMEAFNSSNFARALEILEEAEQNPGSDLTKFNTENTRALIYIEQKMLQKANLHINKAHQEALRSGNENELSSIKNTTFLYYVKQSKFTDAQRVIEESIQINPKNKSAYINYLFTLSKLKQINIIAHAIKETIPLIFPEFLDKTSTCSIRLHIQHDKDLAKVLPIARNIHPTLFN